MGFRYPNEESTTSCRVIVLLAVKMRGLSSAVVQWLLCSTRNFSVPQQNHHRTSSRRMMKGSVYIACTQDGFIATPDGSVGFLDQYNSPPAKEDDEGTTTDQVVDDMGFATFLESVDVIIMGRKSFEKVLSFGEGMWAYGKTPVVVWTRNKDSFEIPDFCREMVTCSSLVPTELMKLLEGKGHKHAYIDGGRTIQEFLRCGLVDELILTRVPLILGDGIPLFGNVGREVPLLHVRTSTYPNGLVMTKYRVKT